MKKFMLFSMLAVVLLALASCDSLNPSERLLVGKWYSQSQQDEDKDGYSFVEEDYSTYNEDKTSDCHGTMRSTYKIDEGVYLIVTYELKAKGTWAIVDKQLQENYTYADVTIKDVEAAGENVNTNKAELREALESEKKRLYYDVAIPMKKSMMGAGVDKIITLNENQLVIVDKDGVKSEYSRMSSDE